MALSDLPCAGCGRLMYRTKGSLPEGQATCRDCRAKRRQAPAGPCPTCGQPCKRTYCSVRCANQRNAVRGGTQRGRTCEACGASFDATYSEQRTCGRVCGVVINARQAQARAKPKASVVQWRECDTCRLPYTARGKRRCGCDAPRSRVFIAECRSCARWFCSPFTVSTCSDVCAEIKRRSDKHHERDRRRALERDAFVSKVHRAVIYERDGWRCKLCGKPVKRAALVPDPLAPTLDHIVPLARGGLHEPSNCQTAHYLCNSRKGAGGSGEQLLLVG